MTHGPDYKGQFRAFSKLHGVHGWPCDYTGDDGRNWLLFADGWRHNGESGARGRAIAAPSCPAELGRLQKTYFTQSANACRVMIHRCGQAVAELNQDNGCDAPLKLRDGTTIEQLRECLARYETDLEFSLSVLSDIATTGVGVELPAEPVVKYPATQTAFAD